MRPQVTRSTLTCVPRFNNEQISDIVFSVNGGVAVLKFAVGLGERTALIHYASAGLAPVGSDKWRLHLARKPTSIFPGIAGGDSGKNKNVRVGIE